jgi:hypothetical protein
MIRLRCPSCGQAADGPDSVATSGEICYLCKVPLEVEAAFPEKAEQRSPLLVILAILNLLNAVYPAIVSVDLVGSPEGLERAWGIFIMLATAGMLGFSVCLLVRPRYSRIAAVVALLLLGLEAAMAVVIGGQDAQSLAGGLLAFLGVIGAALFAIVPVLSLIILTLRARWK